jgi:iron-sulfur cluster repair protein YtfE (RIC family)
VATASEALRHHHEELARKMAEQVRVLTDGTPGADPETLIHFLRDELLPHAAGEDRYLYPAVEPLLKAHGMATATMRMDHRAIEGYVRSIEEAAARLRSVGNAERAAAARELARLVWQLQALFDVHLQKAEQIYMPLLGRYVTEAEQRHILRQMHEGPAGSASPNGEASLDVRTMAPARRHAVIFATYEALGAGQAFVLVNDHDPKPLYYRFQAERSGKFTWT